jgi:hypothetical protein
MPAVAGGKPIRASLATAYAQRKNLLVPGSLTVWMFREFFSFCVAFGEPYECFERRLSQVINFPSRDIPYRTSR